MRNQIKKLVNEKAIINIIKNKIKDEEDTFTWFERNLGILEGSWLSLEISHTLLKDTTNDFESYFRIANYCAQYGDLENLRKNIKTIKYMEELASSIKKKKRLQENKKHEHNYSQKYEEKMKTPLDRPITKIINQIQINETNLFGRHFIS